MHNDEIDELYAQLSKVSAFLSRAYRDLTGEEFELESAVRHYPLVALGLAAGAGALGGWWIARRSKPALPPPSEKTAVETIVDSIRRLGAQRKAGSTQPGQEPLSSLQYLEQLLPQGLETIKKALPEITSEETAAQARRWVDTVLEPKLTQGLSKMSARSAELRRKLQGRDGSTDTHLSDPDN